MRSLNPTKYHTLGIQIQSQLSDVYSTFFLICDTQSVLLKIVK